MVRSSAASIGRRRSRSGGKGVFLVLEKVIDGRDMRAQMLTRPREAFCPRA